MITLVFYSFSFFPFFTLAGRQKVPSSSSPPPATTTTMITSQFRIISTPNRNKKDKRTPNKPNNSPIHPNPA
ncbi:hypothetical protein HOY80DRAFT_963768 [Tuber brumale]|nr:hypothetical protein HOY80DRAFT_963768 [Tuber brumale]